MNNFDTYTSKLLDTIPGINPLRQLSQAFITKLLGMDLPHGLVHIDFEGTHYVRSMITWIFDNTKNIVDYEEVMVRLDKIYVKENMFIKKLDINDQKYHTKYNTELVNGIFDKTKTKDIKFLQMDASLYHSSMFLLFHDKDNIHIDNTDAMVLSMIKESLKLLKLMSKDMFVIGMLLSTLKRLINVYYTNYIHNLNYEMFKQIKHFSYEMMCCVANDIKDKVQILSIDIDSIAYIGDIEKLDDYSPVILDKDWQNG